MIENLDDGSNSLNNSGSNHSQEKVHKNVKKQPKKSRKKVDLGKIFTFGLNTNTEEYNRRIYLESKMDRIRLHAASVFFAGMYDDNRVKMRYMVAAISAIIYSVITFFLVDITGIYSSGTSGLFQGLARLIGTALSLNGMSQAVSNDVYQGLFWGIWFVANLPLIFFAWWKIGKRFTKLTLVFVVVSTVAGLLLSVPIFLNPDNKYSYFFLGNPLTMNSILSRYDVYVLSWNYYPAGSFIHTLPASSILNGGNYNVPFNELTANEWAKIEILRAQAGYLDLNRVLSLLGYTAILIIVYPLAVSVNYIIGGCTGGMDIPSIYWSDKAKKQLGNMLVTFNTSTMFIGIILGSYIPAGMVTAHHWGAEYFFSPNLVLSLIFSIISYLTVNLYFPKYRQSVLKVYSTKTDLIVSRMNELNYPYQLNIYNSFQVIHGQKVEAQVIETIARYIEIPKVIHQIRNVDSDALLTIGILKGIDGELLMNKKDE